MPGTRLHPIEHPDPGAPPRIQARRVLLLARLLTAITATFAAVVYAVAEVFERVGDRDVPFDQYLLDWRLWGVVFVFWTSAMAGMRRPLHLHE